MDWAQQVTDADLYPGDFRVIVQNKPNLVDPSLEGRLTPPMLQLSFAQINNKMNDMKTP